MLTMQEHHPAEPAKIAFAVGLVSLIGAFYAVAGLAVWVVWHALMPH